MYFPSVDPEAFVDLETREPQHGRGAWTRVGIDFDYRYAYSEAQTIGTRAEVSLAHYAVAQGSWAIQRRLTTLGFLTTRTSRKGVFDLETRDAVKEFQKVNVDPDGGAKLVVDGTVGRSDARALFVPMIKDLQVAFDIPGDFLLGQTVHESALDPGAIGYYIFYPDYRGVDRAMSQINSKAHPDITWNQAFTPAWALKYSADRLRSTFDAYRAKYPRKAESVLWDAAICAHNSPVNGNAWAKNGAPPNQTAATYVAAVKNAIF